ncbi:MAG: hypothetical protein LBG65_04430 [Puniceicoccales bacterium]|nr:hypothetical protein [Puniceicoccales bacterium]
MPAFPASLFLVGKICVNGADVFDRGTSRLRHVAGSQWGQKRHMDMGHLKIHAMEERRMS